jgi:hypothetical protein
MIKNLWFHLWYWKAIRKIKNRVKRPYCKHDYRIVIISGINGFHPELETIFHQEAEIFCQCAKCLTIFATKTV